MVWVGGICFLRKRPSRFDDTSVAWSRSCYSSPFTAALTAKMKTAISLWRTAVSLALWSADLLRAARLGI